MTGDLTIPARLLRAPRRPELSFEPSGFFVLRTPLLPVGTLQRWGNDAMAARAEESGAAEAQAADRARLMQRLRRDIADPVVREAIFCASPSLDEAVDAWLRDPSNPRSEGVAGSVARYLARMSGRATPFGLFAGYSLGKIGETSCLRLAPDERVRRHARLDMHYVMSLVEALESDPGLRRVLRWAPSSGLANVAGQVRYSEAHTDSKTRARSYHLMSVDASDALELVLARAAGGATRDTIAEALVAADPELASAEAAAFVDEIIGSQILVSELVPPVTGAEAIHHVVSVLGERAPDHPARVVLERTRDALAALEREPLGVPSSRYKAIAEDLSSLPAPVELPRLFQIDLVKAAPEARLGGLVLAEIERGVDLLLRLSHSREPETLSAFVRAFSERYDQREIQLCEALDEEAGLGFASLGSEPSPLFEGVVFPPPTPSATAPDERFACLMGGITRALRSGSREWMLDERDVQELTRKPAHGAPDAFATLCRIAAASEEALERGDFRVVVEAYGPSGAKLLGRFCQGDPELAAEVASHLRAEEALQPAAVLAEVVHLPEGRLGNVINRPVLRDYEIPYLGSSGASAERQLAVDDLLISVRNGRVVLRSKRLDREVVPRMTNAHNHERSSLSVYRFLCALERQRALRWDWGLLSAAPFLPRVSHGRLVLCPASWKLGERQLEAFGKPDQPETFQRVQALRRELNLPRWVSWADGDNSLPVDLDNVVSVDAFLGAIRHRDVIALEEMLPAPDDAPAQGPAGRYAAEVVVPFVAKRPPAAAAATRLPSRGPRSFLPGSEWLYLKIYTGTATADRLLSEVVAPVAKVAIAEGRIDRWFFIRYSDPGWHLRVRFRGQPSTLMGQLLPEMRQALEPHLASGAVSRVCIDTYEREVERYGGDRGIELAERVFHIDAEAAVELVAACAGQGGADARWRLTLLGMHLLLDDFRVELADRIPMLEDARREMCEELGGDRAFERQLDATFRRERPALEPLLFACARAPGPIAEGALALEGRSRRLAPLAGELSAVLGRRTSRMTWSYLHMHANRVLAGEHRRQELVLYSLLFDLYRSQLARAKRAPRA
jgi:thiopeptide-type bacteriocin biosynthesis protein